MKFISFSFISVLVSIPVSDASNMDHLQHYMQTNLSVPQPPSSFSVMSDSNQSIVSDVCPRELKIAWQVRPPFTLDKNVSEDQSIDGIFHRALNFALEKCCAFYNGKRPIMRYLAVSENSSALYGNIFSGDTSLVFPIQDDLYIDKHRWRYINILNSPGAVLVRREAVHSNKGAELFKAISGTWPIVVLSLLMSSLAGVCVWMLDTKTNPTEFSRPFYLGVFDGFWWAFVTMSTVGYGDKTPKSLSGRLFSVVWIMTGITVCSILTATLSSALTNVSVSVERYDVTTGKTVGARKESFAFKHAVNLGINVTDFNDLYEADHLLENGKLDGILEETFTAIEFIKGKADSGLSVAQVLEEKHGYGAAIKKDGFSHGVWDCLPNVMEFVSYEIYSNASKLLKSVKHSYTPIKNLAGTEVTDGDQNTFDHNSYSFKAIALGVSVALVVFTACAIGFVGVRYLRRQPEKTKKAVDSEAGRK